MITHQFFKKYHLVNKIFGNKQLYFTVSAIIIFIASLTILQDFLESKRSGYSFYFSESILFKIIWFLFIPILAMLYKTLKKENPDTFFKTALFMVAPVLIHLMILPFVLRLFSVLFYEGRYDLYKLFTYTLANDFYKPVLIYFAFVLGYKYISTLKINGISDKKIYPENIIINNGKENTVVKVNDILQITSATPYINIQLDNKKYLHTETLKSICKQLNQKTFVRVHKSAIVNIDKVASFRSRLNGDYDLVLKNGDKIRLSRTYVLNFKKIFKISHQVSL